MPQEGTLESTDCTLVLGSGAGRFVRAVNEGVVLSAPGVVGDYCQDHLFPNREAMDQEELWVLLLDRKNRITHEVLVYRGTQCSCHVRIAELFREAVRAGSAAIIVTHCHPSGDPTPSPEDLQVTRRAQEAARLLDIELLDHIVVGHERFVSMRERGMGF